MAGDRAGALANVDDEAVLSRIQAGEHASSVAASLGVHKSALSHRYKGKAEYVEARELGTEVRLNDLETEIAELSKPLPKPELVDEPTEAELRRYKVELKNWQMDHAQREFNLACARERYRAVSWRAEREFPHRWGAKTQVSGDLSITVQIARGVTYEGEKPNEISEAIPAGSDITTQESGVSD
jgi:AcrR family transcriptional regulator